MVWALVILGVLVFAVISPGFRAILGLLALIGVVLAILLWAYVYSEEKERLAEIEASKKRIPMEQVEFDDMRLGIDAGRLTGRIRNRSSRYTFKGAGLLITVRDCADGAGCEIVWQRSEEIYLDVPPQQARDLSDYVSTYGVGKARGRHSWDYTVQFVRGD